jgi:hypothetical protein
MKPLILTVLLQATLLSTKSQPVDKVVVDERIRFIDTTSHPRQTRLYIINGIAFNETDSIKIDSSLKTYNPKYLVSIDFVTCQQMNLPHCFNDIVLITFAYNQKDKRKRGLLKKIRHSFVDEYVSFSQPIFKDAKDPILYIDNKLVHHTETKEKINALKLKSIYYIDYKGMAVSAEYYGQHAKNGIAKIWTVPK